MAETSKLVFWGRFLALRYWSLSKILGPKWAACTRFWLVKTLASGYTAERFVDLHKQFDKFRRLIIDLAYLFCRLIGSHRAKLPFNQ